MICSLVRPLIFALAASAAFAAEHNTLTTEEQAGGWQLLFDGKTAPGLRGLTKPDFLKGGWTIEDEALTCAKSIKNMGKVTGGSLTTTFQLLDFEFSFDWKIDVAGNSGVVYFPSGFGAKPAGCEYQLIDDTHHPEGLKGGPLHRTGALNGILPTSDLTKVKEPGQWNTSRLVVNGNHVEHWLNEAKVVEYDLGSPELQRAAAANKQRVPGAKAKTALVLLDEGEGIAFRNLKVRALPAPGATAPAPR